MKLKLFITCLFVVTLVKSQEIKYLKKHVFYLAKDKMKGRGTGSKENTKAAKYIAHQFKNYGLKPLGTDGYYQPFEAKVTRVNVSDSIRFAQNVIGFLDNGSNKTIVIGAHYDHIGEGKQGSSLAANSYGLIHNGADDNASGVAGLLELARIYAKNNIQEKVNFLFIAFGAEELGLLGSRYFVQQPTIDLSTIHWMLNMDMIGRLNKDNGVSIIGFGTSTVFKEIIDNIESLNFVKFYTGYEGRGGSDQTSFYEKNIPVLFFHTGGHPDYHRPTDDADKVDYQSLKEILILEKYIIDASINFHNIPFQNTDSKN